jgi:hypothetical protein
MANFDELTTELKKIITNTQKSAMQAWKAGKTLQDIRTKKNFKSKYKNFNAYTKKEFNITDNTAEQYIKIYEKIPLEMITDNMLVSHLYTLAEMPKELKNKVLKTMRWAEENIKSKNSKNKLPYNGNMVLVLKQIIESAKENSLLSEDILQEIFRESLNQDIEDRERRARHKKDPIKEAIPIDNLAIHESFKEVSSIYSYAPISEQGLVGLFCTIFHILKKETIDYKGKPYNFSKILYIRVEFPDAKIELTPKPIDQQLSLFPSVDDIDSLGSVDNIDIKLDIEFELHSVNYWKHKHHEATEKCDMIICWETGKVFEAINRPPILSIKELLKSGEIILH